MPDTAIASRRMRNLLISGPKTETPADVVRRLGALQAQDYAQATWAIGLRTKSATLADVERAIADRRIVLTWLCEARCMRCPPKTRAGWSGCPLPACSPATGADSGSWRLTNG